ncbi:alanine/glycine:cation symporter family protein [Enterocloster lavalensis]|uniref:alanine/glycine:cation symporter family protein n=1 Tax=Enterocloster lavalensis TaxID=460384 RepID=UPI0023F56822|nr:alanine/glycine:cation symporter family protein [Enterocloster lavalensis]
MNMEHLAAALDNFTWGPAMIVIMGVTAVFFTVLMGFPQIRLFRHLIINTFGGNKKENGISPFQSFSIALGGRVGTGTITGTAGAILAGGPGAVFWMWLIALLGSATAFVESTLGQIFKKKIRGEYVGGPAFYIETGLGWKKTAAVYAGVTAFFMLIFASIQSNAFASIVKSNFQVSSVLIGVAYAVLLFLVIFGGAKKIAKVAEVIVPFMTAGYILLALVMFIVNYQEIPHTFGMIFKSAFGIDAVFGGIVGNAISWGFKRGSLSHEAGQGTGAMVSGTAEVSHPAKSGLAQAFSVIVTILISTATVFMIFSTKSFNVASPAGGFLMENVKGLSSGEFTSYAINSFVPGFGAVFISVAMFLFTFTTVLAYSIYLESSVVYFLKEKAETARLKQCMTVLNVLMIGMVVSGAFVSADLVWSVASICSGIVSIINLISVFCLRKYAFAALKDYERQVKAGIDPVFVPKDCDIQHAELWERIVAEQYADEKEEYGKVFGR